MLHPVPASMKIHPSALHTVELADGRVTSAAYSSASFRLMSKKIDFERSDLRVEFASSSVDQSSAEAAVRSKLSGEKHAGLEKLSSFRQSSSARNVWSELRGSSSGASVDSLRGQGQCAYSSLEFRAASSSLSVTGLHRLAGSPSGRACLGNLVATLALERDVVNVYVRPHDTILNDYGKSIVQANTYQSGQHPYNSAGLDGTGQVVGVGDTGLDDLHCMFINDDESEVLRSTVLLPLVENGNRKVIQYVAYANGKDTKDGHGTHVTGTIAGFDSSGSLSAEKGHASGAKITFFDMSDNGQSISYPTPISDWVFQPTYNAGGRIHSNSWGSYGNQYDSTCRDIDEYHYDTDDFLALFAAGNDGDEGFYSIASPATAKNSMAIGASRSSSSFGDLAYFSSMGPTFDNRFKPDVVAPGYFTQSSAARTSGQSCGLTSKAGTSMATPAVAGNAAIIRQFFDDDSFWEATCNSAYSKCGAFNPRGATVKAMLIHSGEAMDEYPGGDTEGEITLVTTPDFLQGFGRVSLQNVLPLSGTTVAGLDLFVDEISMSSFKTTTYTVAVTGSASPLKATIAWMDPPASTTASKLLIHDIDLKVIAPDGTTVYYGNEFAGDEENNVEQVFIPSPTSGDYTVVLTSKSITYESTQKVSVVITSVGSVSGPATGSVSSDVANYPLQCSGGQSQVTVLMVDKGTNGWGSDNRYRIIRTSDSVEVKNGRLDSSSKGNFYEKDTFCLDDDSYIAQLDLSGSRADEVGFSIHACDVFLNNLYTSDSFTLSSNTCGACSENSMEIVLQGSEYGVPYGWAGDSSYTIKSDDAGVDIIGTLEVGIVDVRGFCFPDGVYNITFANVPGEDDWGGFNDDVFEGYFGIQEYAMSFTCGGEDVTLNMFSCNDNTGKCVRINQLALLDLSGGDCDVLLITNTDTTPDSDDDDNSPFISGTILIVIIIGGVVVIGAFLVLLYNLCCGASRGAAEAAEVQMNSQRKTAISSSY